MYFKSKKTSLVILGLTSIVFARVMFMFFNDPEGPNLLVVFVMSGVVYCLTLVIYLHNFLVPTSGLKRLLLAIIMQAIIVSVLYFALS
jgi:hypothetical protein